ncbi:MAG: YIP1 family protein [Acidobacteriota bacterium]|nr:YIP1 family protein [Acidobacteriota bacterium]
MSSPAERCFGVFTEPVKAFASIARVPDFWTPLILETAITIAATEMLLSRVGMERIVRESIEASGRASSMSAQQLQTAISQGAKYGSIFAHVSGVISMPILVLVFAVVGMAIMKFVYGSAPRFKTAYSVTAYAALPLFLSGILAIIVIVFGDPESIRAGNLTPTNIGFFLPLASTSRPLMSIAKSIDFFSFWVMGLLGIAFASTTGGKAKPRNVFFFFLGLWVIFVLIRAGLAAI